MTSGSEFPREYESTRGALKGFGEQLLEVATEREDGALVEGSEQLVFRNPDGIGFKTLDLDILQLFIEANAPMYDSSPIMRDWRETDGLVESAHTWWRLQPRGCEVLGQLRGRQIEGNNQHALQCKIAMEHKLGSMCATDAGVQIGTLDQFGNVINGLSLAFDVDSLDASTNSQADELLGHLVNEMRSIFTYAEAVEGNGIRAYRYPIVE